MDYFKRPYFKCDHGDDAFYSADNDEHMDCFLRQNFINHENPFRKWKRLMVKLRMRDDYWTSCVDGYFASKDFKMFLESDTDLNYSDGSGYVYSPPWLAESSYDDGTNDSIDDDDAIDANNVVGE
jgi:hypothetical protein